MSENWASLVKQEEESSAAVSWTKRLVPGETFSGEVTLNRIFFPQPHQENKGWYALQFDAGDIGFLNASGHLAFIPFEGMRLWVEGTIVNHPKYGLQVEITKGEERQIDDEEYLKTFLSKVLFGVGPVYAERIVNHFGSQTIDILDNHPQRLIEISGISQKMIEPIEACWVEHRFLKNIITELQKYDLTISESFRIYNKFQSEGKDVLQVIKQNPYSLCQVRGISFIFADKVALAQGIDPNDARRIQALIEYVLLAATWSGNCYLPKERLILSLDDQSSKLKNPIDIKVKQITQILEEMHKEKLVVIDDDRIYLSKFYHLEEFVADEIIIRVQIPVEPPEYNLPSGEVEYSQEQYDAIQVLLRNKVVILTGGPGVGKTTVLRAFLDIVDGWGKLRILCSPTGIAAKRMEFQTGRPAATIHKTLALKKDYDLEHDIKTSPIRADYLIIDETSMVDLQLFASILASTDRETQIIIVGDADQLASVGPGKVLPDLINSDVVKCVRLKKIFRQAEGSQIIHNAHAINNGDIEGLNIPRISDFVDGEDDMAFMVKNKAEDVVDATQKVIEKFLNERLGYSLEDIQVLSPMRKYDLGTVEINSRLQDFFNPIVHGTNDRFIESKPYRFRLGDRVIQTENDYDKDVFNGDIGHIVYIDPPNRALGILFKNKDNASQDPMSTQQQSNVVHYDNKDIDQLELSYALTVHKCIVGESLIFTEYGMREIKTMCNTRSDGSRLKDIEEGVMTQNGIKTAVQSFTGDYEETLILRTHMDYEIEGSGKHRILVWDSESLETQYKIFSDIEEGDIAVIQRGQDIFSDRYVEIDYSPNGLPNRKNNSTYPIVVDERVAELMGYLVGDGSYRENKNHDLCLHSADDFIIERFRYLIKELFGGNIVQNRSRTGKCKTFYYIDKTARECLIAMGLDYASCRDKKIPWSILISPRSVQSSFFRALFDTDGSASGNTTRVVLSTSSEHIARQTQVMLLNMGIISRRIFVDKSNSYRIEIYGQNTAIFQEFIGFGLEYKRLALSKIVDRSDSKKGKTNTDHIPGAQRLISSLRDEIKEEMGKKYSQSASKVLGLKVVKLMSSIASGFIENVGYHHLKIIIESLTETNISTPSYAKILEIYDNHYFYDEIEAKEPSAAEVYDLSVPGEENYIANGFISHNSQGSEFPVVVLLCHKSFGIMLQRRLYYTALTRTQKLCVMVGQVGALTAAIQNLRERPRYTYLEQRLVDKANEEGMVLFGD